MKKTVLLILTAAALSACSSVKHFNTDKTDIELTTPDNKARLKITSPVMTFGVAGDCIDLDKTAKLIAKVPRNRSRDTVAENMIASIGMPAIELSEFTKFKYDFSRGSYASREIEIDADKPFTVFIKKSGSQASVAFGGDDGKEFAFGYWFIPEKGRDYQVIVQAYNKRGLTGPGFARYGNYMYALFDITNGEIENLTPKMLAHKQRAGMCKK